jgi:hypothetical protein
VSDRILELNQRDEIMWQQRSRVQWLKVGDKNTKIIHLRASQRKKKNKILRLKKEDGSLTEDVKELETMTTNFYTNLYRSEGDK